MLWLHDRLYANLLSFCQDNFWVTFFFKCSISHAMLFLSLLQWLDNFSLGFICCSITFTFAFKIDPGIFYFWWRGDAMKLVWEREGDAFWRLCFSPESKGDIRGQWRVAIPLHSHWQWAISFYLHLFLFLFLLMRSSALWALVRIFDVLHPRGQEDENRHASFDSRFQL